ncbi:hypothetical protein IFM89_004331 [Coptis chinensis]|uniref:Uncharacterized protein n=1 Tax=Coptis chinensis TaxID=261450 RepID=A0A835I7C4_9MAGN|nr:hypothetical protein IFM89_004331 [Coptis chinensis]
MLRNPRCCVAYPHVFKQPWAIVSPETMLRLGQKFYVVPISTIRKLQKLSLKSNSSPSQDQVISSCQRHQDQEDEEAGMRSTCWMFVNQNSPHTGYKQNTSSTDGRTTTKEDEEGWFSGDNCFTCLLTGIKLKEDREASSDDTPSNNTSRSSSETRELNRKRSRDSHLRKGPRGSPKRHSSFDNWQPSLASIDEE